MAKISLAGFKDPVRRPRYIIWTVVAVFVIAAVLVAVLGVTSTRWFCAEGCHKVQDDTIIAYQHSSHSEVSCMACHMPVSADPITFMLHKAEALGELYLTVTDNFELPLNAESEVSLTMASTQCTQCHNLNTRPVTASKGIKIDHEVHGEINAACTVCHNRVAHREDFELTGKDPETGTTHKHTDFMTMTACFRCHGLEKGAAAPGACEKCHEPGFELKPASHNEEGFFPGGHADLAAEMKAEAEKAANEAEAAEGEKAEESEETSFLGPEKAYASGGESEKKPVAREDVPQVIAAQRSSKSEDHESIGEELPKVESIYYCATCHTDQFCTNCHGMEMPHSETFKDPKDPKDTEGHPAVSTVKADKCVQCHGKNEETHYCDSCHHGTAVKYEYDKAVAWASQHPAAVKKSGVESCTKDCHTAKFCTDCHTGKNIVPSSHKDKAWTKTSKETVTVFGKTPAEPSAKHALEANAAVESCAVCHGEGGTKAGFCKACHKTETPHPDTFKKQHVSGKKTQELCKNCHSWTELCSNCHHIGASFDRTWIRVHGGSVNKNGTTTCVEKCHKKTDCVSCHQKTKTVPSSHAGKKFVRDYSKKLSVHADQFQKGGDICTYCHSGSAADMPNSKFCKSCHKVDIPHPESYGLKDTAKGPQKDNGGKHAEELEKAKTKRPKQCANCHTQGTCDACHHKGLNKKQTWKSQHDNYVKKEGPNSCIGSEAGCHEVTFCAYCHVRLPR